MILLRLWRGELPLAEAFWTWAVLVALVVNLFTTIGFYWLVMAERTMAAFLVGYVVAVAYNILAGVGTWRSAGRPDADPRWAGPARLAVVIGMTILSLT